MPTDILSLSWQIQVALGSGYAAYLTAYRGNRAHHTAVDATFMAIAFGLVATACLYLFRRADPIIAGVMAFIITLIGAGLWKRRLSPLWHKWLRDAHVSLGDDTSTAWVSMICAENHLVTQIAVLTSDDRWLRCDDASAFAGAPHGPCVLGTNGDIVMYLTHVKENGVERKVTAYDEDYGYRATYIPASHVRQVNIRHT
jgi:hypothetical protein